MTIGIYGSRRQEDNKEALATFFAVLAAHSVKIVMHRHLYDSLAQFIPDVNRWVDSVVDSSDFSADVALSFGGDGTFLRTAMWVGDKEIPILGVNTGHLGYLTSAYIDDLPAIAAELLSGRYHLDCRSLIHVKGANISTWPYALNEVVVNKYDTSSIVTTDAEINGQPLASYRSDGLIVATPTGSTAYNLSAGGPVIQPTAPVWVMSPIAAHSLSMRPLVVSDDSVIDLTVSSRATGFRLTIDGRTGTLPVGSRIRLVRAPFRTRVICREGYEFPVPLRTKLFWGMK